MTTLEQHTLFMEALEYEKRSYLWSEFAKKCRMGLTERVAISKADNFALKASDLYEKLARIQKMPEGKQS